MSGKIKRLVSDLYTGTSERSKSFRYCLIAFDFATILYFIITAPLEDSQLQHVLNFLIAVLIVADFSARLWIAPNRRWMLIRIYTLADIVVILSLIIEPFIGTDLDFLRILRGLRLIHSYHLLGDLRRDSVFFRTHEDAIIAAVTLFVFVFVTASAVYAIYVPPGGGVSAYIDAIYFTVTTLTTTGFGDITPTTPWSKLFTVLIMVVGVTLFLRLAQVIFRPPKVRYHCYGCGLERHEPDAVHCKHCGRELHITTEGSG